MKKSYFRHFVYVYVGKSRYHVIKKTYNIYCEVINSELESVYQQVEQIFKNHYRLINQEDESNFEAKITPSIGKLGFDVDFYGRGFFPPGAYHSEGHQDGMGLCLYLTLMEHLLQNHFTFSILDDVLMSVDTGHRREVCNLLKQKFPNTQFILTTHDDIWLRHMKTAGLIHRGGFIHFRTWDVDHGPTEWNDRDVWDELNEHINKNDIRGASALLRHYLEFFAKEACHRLRAQVVFRGDGQFSLGDTLPPAVKRLNDLIKIGLESAKSWGQNELINTLSQFQERLGVVRKSSELDQWQINAAVHYNQWASLVKEDFEPLISIFKELTQFFECEKCMELLYVVPDRGKKESLRCGCGNKNINLRKK